MLLHVAGPAPGLMKIVATEFRNTEYANGPYPAARPAVVTFDEYGTKTGSSWGHSTARGALGVGASLYRDTPAFGVSPPRVAPYSSAGGSPILFDTAGNRLATPEVRQQPGIIAPTDVDTTFYVKSYDPAASGDTDGNGFPNFGGTSAATPHAAGVAALMKDLAPSATPDAIYQAMKRTAIDMDDPGTAGFDTGFDFGTGFGLIQANKALNEVAIRPSVPPSEDPTGAPPLEPPGTPPGTPILPPDDNPPGTPPSERSGICSGMNPTIVGTTGGDILMHTGAGRHPWP
jgi:subtilisin family serine protease